MAATTAERERPERRFVEMAAAVTLTNDERNGAVVQRSELKRALTDYLDSSIGNVLIVTGPPGAGKTSEVRRALDTRTGVIPTVVPIHGPLGFGSTYSALLRAFGLTVDAASADVLREQLVPFLKASARLQQGGGLSKGRDGAPSTSRGGASRPAGSLWLPVLLVELDAGLPEATIAAVVRALKYVVVEERAARAVLVLADPHEIFAVQTPALLASPDTASVLWVGDLTEREAGAYLSARKCLVPGRFALAGELRAELLRAVGTRLRTLDRACTLLERADEADHPALMRAFIDERTAAAARAVDNLLAAGDGRSQDGSGRSLDFRRLLSQLVESAGAGPRPLGGGELSRGFVPCGDAPYLPPPCDVVPVLRRPLHDAVVFNSQAHGYQFNTVGHARAARERLLATLTRVIVPPVRTTRALLPPVPVAYLDAG